ncbi:MAG: hypothetical protein MAG715_00413 [Methanonatronarchaeales archaeon]|nr:hypothetical protein [Methanonatronarchaeales archaeon]
MAVGHAWQFQCLHCGCSFSLTEEPGFCPGCGERESFYRFDD